MDYRRKIKYDKDNLENLEQYLTQEEKDDEEIDYGFFIQRYGLIIRSINKNYKKIKDDYKKQK